MHPHDTGGPILAMASMSPVASSSRPPHEPYDDAVAESSASHSTPTMWSRPVPSSRVVTLGCRNQWQYHDGAVLMTLDRLDIDRAVDTTTGAKTAARHLDEHLDAARPVLI